LRGLSGLWRGLGRNLGRAGRQSSPLAVSGQATHAPLARGQDARWQKDAAIFATFLDDAPQPMLAFDRDRIIRWSNRAAQALLGAPLAGRSLLGLWRHPPLLHAIAAAFKSGAELHEAWIALPEQDGRQLLANVRPLAASIHSGPLAGAQAMITIQDVSAARQTERLRRDFIANVSHELKTPLAALTGFIETLRGPAREDAAARARFLGIMQEQTARMNRLVGDLLSLSRIEMNERSLPRGTVDLGAVLKAAVDGLAPQAASRNMQILLPTEALPVIPGDSDEIAQVMINLIENAIKYGRSGTSVSVTFRQLDGRVALAVIDVGEGIARPHLPRLTERFYRVDPARSRELGGTGLGLAIVKHIVNRHRGSLEIASTPGQGSTFTVYFPA